VKHRPVLVLALIGLALPAGTARAGCFPVRSEVVSLGEKAARFYAERSLVKAIDEQKGSVESAGDQLGRVTKSELDCQPFPNLIGADEWRCVGAAKVCTQALSGEKPVPAKGTGLAAKKAAKQETTAFSSKVGTGLRRENAAKQETKALSSKVDTGLRRENATQQDK
jgi:hypothetical protein